MIAQLIRFRRDQRGVAAVEFALIAPVLIAMYFGLAEYCQAMMADRKATHVASSIGDLVAQSDQVTAADVADIFAIGKPLIAPFPVTDLKIRVASVKNTNNVAVVEWGRGSGWAGRPKTSTVPEFPKSSTDGTKLFISPGETVIMSEVEYSYDSPVDYFLKNKVVFKETFYLRPRKGDAVTCADC